MSHAAEEYVLSLTGINRRQKFFLLILACHHQGYRETYWPSHESLAQEAMCDAREVRRMIQQTRDLGIITVTPGRGQGKGSDYGFPAIENRVNIPSFEGTKEGTKEGKYTRPNKELQTQIQNQNPPTPLAGGKLTSRQLGKLKDRVDFWSTDKHSGRDGMLSTDDPRRHDALPLIEAIQVACKELLIPLDCAMVAFVEAGYSTGSMLADIALKKAPRGVAS